MLKRALTSFLTHSSSHRVKCAAMSAVTIEQSNNKWDLYAGVLVERLPVISKSFNKVEQEYSVEILIKFINFLNLIVSFVSIIQDHLNQIEFEKSYKSDFEIRDENDKLLKQLTHQKGNFDEIDAALQQTAQDMKDAWKDELHTFQLSSRITEADRKSDVKSTNRKLEETLILLVEQMVGDKKLMLLPQGKRRDGETMRQTAERVLKENCGDGIEVLFYGNAPCGFYKWKYPNNQRKETVGAKVFFFRSVYKKGRVSDKQPNYEWLDKDEFNEKLKNQYADSVSQFLL